MSSFKQLSKADVTSVSYAANKQWNLPFSCPSISNSYFNIYNGTFITGTFLPDDFLTDPFTNGQYERLVYDSMNHLFYQKFSGSLDTSSLMFNTNTYQSASEQRPTGAYFDYNTNPLLVKNFPTESGAKIRVLSVDQDIYGSKVLPNSFRLSSSVYDITDDGNGNLYNTGSVHIGNIFYAHGLSIITNPDYQDIFPSPPIAVNNIATFLTTNTSVKTINILQNDISRSCAIDTGSVVLYGSNAAYYTVNSDGTITLNVSSSGNYDVYYTVNSKCGNGCSLTSNKAKITTRIVQCNPPACITVEFYGGKPDQIFYYVECGTTVTSSLTLNDTDAPVQKCINASFGVSGSSNYTYVSDCSPSSTPSDCSLYLLCAADRAPAAIFYYVTCSGASVTESLGTSGDCLLDANYRCITGSITLANPYGSYQLISLNCGTPSPTTTSTTTTTTTAAPTTSTTTTTTTAAPTTSTTTTTTTTLPVVAFDLGYAVTNGSDACQNAITSPTFYFAAFGSTFTAGTILYTDSGLTTLAPDDYYSDGTTWYLIIGGNGTLTGGTPCSGTTTTTTTTTAAPTTSTTTTTTTAAPTTSTTTTTTTAAPTTTSTTTTTTTTCPPLPYSYTLEYDTSGGGGTLNGFATSNDACTLTTNSITVYSPSGSFAAGTPLYTDICGLFPIKTNPYNSPSNLNYYKYSNNYVTFETDAYTVRSVTPCGTTTTSTTTTTTTVEPPTTTTSTTTTTTTVEPPTTTTSTTTSTTTVEPPTTTTSTTTTTTTTPPPTELFVYAKYINTAPGGGDELEYQINAGSWLSFGAPISSTTCAYFNTVSGVSNGDTVSFRTTLTTTLSGDPSSCPGSAFCTTPSVVISTGANYIYLTTDGGSSC